ncbi:hypothetical protein BD408DRAFT_411086 [Parasitella parasitica]|nr:hypothetical protein BD408DRAFT_411086 [Parasitella parasitica]
MKVDQQTETNSVNDATTSRRVCSSCGQESHLRSTTKSIYNNTHNMARRSTPSFTERHDLGGRNSICHYCQARMWAERKMEAPVQTPISLCAVLS